mgnify:CR=1 FL=1
MVGRLLLFFLCVATPSFTSAGAARAADVSSSPEMIAWVECLQSYGRRHAKADATVETIATAAIGFCRSEDQAVLDLVSRRPTALRFVLGPLTREERQTIRENHERLREEFRERLMGDILEARMAPPGDPS